MRPPFQFRFLRAGMAVFFLGLFAADVHAFILHGLTDNGLDGSRWDADAAELNSAGVSRTLADGLSVSVQGGGLQSLRDALQWSGGVPTMEDFESAFNRAFNAWQKPDTEAGLASSLSFHLDLSTPFTSSAYTGADIDIGWRQVAGGAMETITVYEPRAEADGVTLTSGTLNYPATAIWGVQIYVDSEAFWTLTTFRQVMTHEIGHAIGLGHPYSGAPNGQMVDDNYNPADPAGTLTNSFSGLIDPYWPANSSSTIQDAEDAMLSKYTMPAQDVQDESMNFVMASPADENELSVDEFAARQYLYPALPVPEPSAALLTLIALTTAGFQRRR